MGEGEDWAVGLCVCVGGCVYMLAGRRGDGAGLPAFIWWKGRCGDEHVGV